MIIKFFLNQCSYLRYFIPLALQAKALGHEPHFYIKPSGKHNDIFRSGNFEPFINLCQKNNFSVFKMEDGKSLIGISFFIEGNFAEQCHPGDKKISIITNSCYNTPTILPNGQKGPTMYETYIDKVDHVIFPGRIFAERYGSISDKNIYIGSPKYDVKIDKDSVYEKYNLQKDQKYALFLYPKLRDAERVNIVKIHDSLRSMGYKIIVKTRAKDSVVDPKRRGDEYFEDVPPKVSWCPYTTVELMKISEIAINFGSTAITECAYSRIPVLNFDIKPRLLFDFLYEYDFVHQFSRGENPTQEEIVSAVRKLLEKDHSASFDKCYTECLGGDKKDVSNRLLKMLAQPG
tara:strand:- start:2135 stop:3172 length:1038 start_codon:yes stop_codon:yes gene_type:complete